LTWTPPQAVSPDSYVDLTVAERDYSGTPLTKKLGAKPGADVVVYFTTSRAELESASRA